MPSMSVSQFFGSARRARRAALCLELIERHPERGHDVRRRREAPLRRLLHVRPLVVQVHRERVGISLRLLQHRAAHDDEAHAGWAFDAFSRRRDDRVDRVLGHVDVDRAEGAHCIHDEAAAPALRMPARCRGAGSGFPFRFRSAPAPRA
jgi:hypothetical protein